MSAASLVRTHASAEVLLEQHKAIGLIHAAVQAKVSVKERRELGGRSVVRDFRRCHPFPLPSQTSHEGQEGEGIVSRTCK